MQLLGSFAGWVRHFIGLVEDITLRDASGRVACYLLETADTGGGRVRLNLTSETLSCTLRQLTDAGLIAPGGDGSELAIRDRDQLRRVCDGLTPEL